MSTLSESSKTTASAGTVASDLSTGAISVTAASDASSSSTVQTNLDQAIPVFTSRFVPSNKFNVGNILQGISENAKTLYIAQANGLNTVSVTSTRTASTMTVFHKLDNFTDDLVRENFKLLEENSLLKAELATLKEQESESNTTSAPDISGLSNLIDSRRHIYEEDINRRRNQLV